MKSLSLPTPHVLILIGHPGAGKSFFARQFSETFGAPVVSADTLCYEIFEKPTYSKGEVTLIQKLSDHILEEMLKTKHTILYDGQSTTKSERSRIASVAKKAGYNTLLIWVQTDEATTRLRATRRNKATQQATATHNLSPEQYDQQVQRFEQPSLTEPYVVISGKHTYATQAKAVLKKLTEDRREAPAKAPERAPMVGTSSRRSIPIK
ncbi:MAG TPA: ATP-binding protein [Candidatus Saccharimonadales bacterium]